VENIPKDLKIWILNCHELPQMATNFYHVPSSQNISKILIPRPSKNIPKFRVSVCYYIRTQFCSPIMEHLVNL
jgi:hypothetical protein